MGTSFTVDQMAGLLKAVLKAESIDLIAHPAKPNHSLRVGWEIPYTTQMEAARSGKERAFVEWFRDLLCPLAELVGLSETPKIDALNKTIVERDAEISDLKMELKTMNLKFDSYISGVKDSK